jgi:hypothetical protein
MPGFKKAKHKTQRALALMCFHEFIIFFLKPLFRTILQFNCKIVLIINYLSDDYEAGQEVVGWIYLTGRAKALSFFLFPATTS